MPVDPPPSNPGSKFSVVGGTKCPLVRSKSLRLPSSKSRNEQPSNTNLTRHGSIRQSKNQATSGSTSRLQPLSVLKKPFLKPKPTCVTSKSTENIDRVTGKAAWTDEPKRQLSTCKSPTKHVDGHQVAKGVTFFNDSHPTPSDSPTSLHSDKSQQSQDNSSSWNSPSSLIVHLKRLTEEHEKLQVEYARARLQLLETTASNQMSVLRRDQHLSHSDSHLASIPENASGDMGTDLQRSFERRSDHQESLVQGYRSEVLRLQEENRKIQRRYWEQVMNSESIEDELGGGSSQQIVDLIDKLDMKQREIVQLNSFVHELENQLAQTNLELHQCQDALQDYQRMLEDSNSQKDKLEKEHQGLKSRMADLRDDYDFLQIERSTLAESLQEAEQNLATTKAEMKLDKEAFKELMDRACKLYAKVQDKNLQIQLLQSELDATQGRARDMILSQGAELTTTAVYLHHIQSTILSMVTDASEFAVTELGLQQEMLEEVMLDLDLDSEEKDTSPGLSLENGSAFNASDECQLSTKDAPTMPKPGFGSHSIPDISSVDIPKSPIFPSPRDGSERPLSNVQSMVKALEKNSKQNAQGPKQSSLSKSTSEIHSKSTSEIDSAVRTGSLATKSINEWNRKNDTVYPQALKSQQTRTSDTSEKPVGKATAFRPITLSSSVENITPSDISSNGENNTVSVTNQLEEMNHSLKKLHRIIKSIQARYVSKIRTLSEENSQLRNGVTASKNSENQLLRDYKVKCETLEKSLAKAEEMSANLKTKDKQNIEEIEAFKQQVFELKEQNKCLEAVNAEQSRQLAEEVRQVVESTVGKPESEYLSNAKVICDKLELKQEIARLKEVITQKEQLLNSFAQKFYRTKKILEENVQKAENEVQFLDGIVEKVYETLKGNPELVESSEVLKTLFSVVSGNCASEGTTEKKL